MALLHFLFLIRCFLFFPFLNSFSLRPKESFRFFRLHRADVFCFTPLPRGAVPSSLCPGLLIYHPFRVKTIGTQTLIFLISYSVFLIFFFSEFLFLPSERNFSLFSASSRGHLLFCFSFPGCRSFVTLPRAIDLPPFQGENNQEPRL